MHTLLILRALKYLAPSGDKRPLGNSSLHYSTSHIHVVVRLCVKNTQLELNLEAGIVAGIGFFYGLGWFAVMGDIKAQYQAHAFA